MRGNIAFHDLEARDVRSGVHVQEDRAVAEQLLDAEVEHGAVAAVQLHRVLHHLHDLLGGEHLGHVAERVRVWGILIDRERSFSY